MADLGIQLGKIVNELLQSKIKPVEPATDAVYKDIKGSQFAQPDFEYIDDISKYIDNVEIGLAGTQPQVRNFLYLLASLMEKHYPDQRITITSGLRTPAKQYSVMEKNWRRNGGDTPISEENPVVFNRKKYKGPFSVVSNGKTYRLETLGDVDTVKIYGLDVGLKFSKSLEDGEINDEPPEIYWTRYWKNKFENHISKGFPSHGSGAAIDFASINKPFMSDLFRKAKKYAQFTVRSERNRKNPHWHVEVLSAPGVPQKVASLNKDASVSVIIEPFNSLIKEVMDEIDACSPGYFSNVKYVVLENGSPDHYGMVRSDRPDTIFVSYDKIRNLVGSSDNVEQLRESLIEVLGHEMGHLRSSFQGGEAPADSESAALINKMKSCAYTLDELSEITEFSFVFKRLGMIKESEVITKSLLKESQYSDPAALAEAILKILSFFVYKVKIENRPRYIQNIQKRLYSLDPSSIAAKKKNPGAGIGASISVIKNILNGEQPYVVSEALRMVYEGMSRL